MATDWDAWDRTTSIIGALKYRSTEISRNLGEMQLILEALQQRPDFHTEMEEALGKTALRMEEALAGVRKLQNQYQLVKAAA